MVVICPKCKTRLKIADEKLAPGGSRFKCPKCGAVLLVKKPLPAPEKPGEGLKILVAHSKPAVAGEIVALLEKSGYSIITASDGVETMVKSIKERPALAIAEVGLPKVYGFEVCKRLKQRPETKGMKFILVNSVYDKDKYKREPESLYGADDYIEEHRIPELLMDSIRMMIETKPAAKPEEKMMKPPEPVSKDESLSKPEPGFQPAGKNVPLADERIERARRLARTIISDIYLYNTAKADEAIRDNTFHSAFAADIKEGLKLYKSRIAQDVRAQGDFFEEALTNFIERKKKVS